MYDNFDKVQLHFALQIYFEKCHAIIFFGYCNANSILKIKNLYFILNYNYITVYL